MKRLFCGLTIILLIATLLNGCGQKIIGIPYILNYTELDIEGLYAGIADTVKPADGKLYATPQTMTFYVDSNDKSMLICDIYYKKIFLGMEKSYSYSSFAYSDYLFLLNKKNLLEIDNKLFFDFLKSLSFIPWDYIFENTPGQPNRYDIRYESEINETYIDENLTDYYTVSSKGIKKISSEDVLESKHMIYSVNPAYSNKDEDSLYGYNYFYFFIDPDLWES
ncbi:MAG: hypothetical protein FWF08_00490 [Oscillospiraceae bacterium]|nr:hypothetical protein [Oscillospiraceae bacterium]